MTDTSEPLRLARLTPLFFSVFAIGVIVSAVARSSALARNVAVPLDDSDEAAHVRPGSREVLVNAQTSIEQIRTRTERLATRAARTEDVKGKGESLRKEIIEVYRLIHSVELAGDDLLLRGERDGERLRDLAMRLTESLDAAVAALRSHLGSPAGLINATTRRAKEQLGAVKQLDELIKQQKWTDAHLKLQYLLEAADEVGRFPHSEDSEPLFRPLRERAAPVRAGYLVERKLEVLPALRQEFTECRPNVDHVRKRLAAVSQAARDKGELSWEDRPVTGPELISRIADNWPRIDESVLKAAAVLHAIGPAADSELRSLRSEYDAARVEAVTLVRDLILCDTHSSTPAAAESRYAAYLAAVPRFMTALHAAPENAIASNAALSQLAAKSAALESQVRAYRAATLEAFRWRRRIAARYLQNFREQIPAQPIAKLIDQPPARSAAPTGAPVLPGQKAPPNQQRITQMAWTIEQSPESIAAKWAGEWNGTRARVSTAAIDWRENGDARFISTWHRRTIAETECSRQTLLDAADRLAKDLLVGRDRPPITIEAAVAVHSAEHGPYAELGGTLHNVVLENIPDRLFDRSRPGDIFGALTPSTLVAYPAMPALVRVQLKLEWLVHDLFAEAIALPAAQSPTTTPAPAAPSAPLVSETPAGVAPPVTGGTSTPSPVAPNAPRTADDTTLSGSPVTPRPPSKKEPAVQPPAGGVRF
jgi:hypothetical protein